MKRALVLGSAHSVWRDLARVEAVTGPWQGPVIATNDLGIVLPRLDHWATLHPEKMPDWIAARRANGLPDTYRTWSHTAGSVDHVVKGWSNGSSGLLAVGVALALGADEVILCGLRMDKQRNHFRTEKGWGQALRYRAGWQSKQGLMRGRVHSMSGWTRDLLGAPPWLSTLAL